MREKIGLWLAYWALFLTGNRELSTISQVLPAIRERHLAIDSKSLGHRQSQILFGTEWWLWDPSTDVRSQSQGF
jgi:hypothetical protein